VGSGSPTIAGTVDRSSDLLSFTLYQAVEVAIVNADWITVFKTAQAAAIAEPHVAVRNDPAAFLERKDTNAVAANARKLVLNALIKTRAALKAAAHPCSLFAVC
jgi:hypothetical protein